MSGGLENTLAGTLLLWGIALPCFWHSMELLLKGEFRQSPRILLGFVVGFGAAYGGATVSGWITPELGRSLARWLQPITSDARWAILAWVLFFAWFVGPHFVERMWGGAGNALRFADEDATIMEQRVHWYTKADILGRPDLTSTAPWIEFHLPMVNTSVFTIHIEAIEGRLNVDGDVQPNNLEFADCPQSFEVQRGGYNDIALRYWLRNEVAGKMQRQIETKFFLAQTVRFSFEHRGKRRTFSKPINAEAVWKSFDGATEDQMREHILNAIRR
jgi:hypothetical protein